MIYSTINLHCKQCQNLRKTMRLKDYPLGPLTSLFLMSLSSGYFLTYISVVLTQTQHPTFTVGLIQSAFQAGLILAALHIEKLILPLGYIQTFVFLSALNTMTIFCQALSPNPIFWIILRLIAGYCNAGLYVVIEGWLLGICPGQNRGRMLALYLICFYSAQTISQSFVQFIDNLSVFPYLISGLISILSMIPILLTKIPTPSKNPVSPTLSQLSRLARQAPLGTFACFISGIILSAIYTFGPIFAYESKLNISLVMGSLLAGGMLLQGPIGKISDQMDRQKLLMLLGSILILPSLTLHWMLPIPSLFFLFCFMIGGISFVLYPVGIAFFVDRIPQHNVLSAAAIALLSYSVGAVIGPLLTAMLFATWSPFILFQLIAASGALLAIASRRHNYGITELDK